MEAPSKSRPRLRCSQEGLALINIHHTRMRKSQIKRGGWFAGCVNIRQASRIVAEASEFRQHRCLAEPCCLEQVSLAGRNINVQICECAHIYTQTHTHTHARTHIQVDAINNLYLCMCVYIYIYIYICIYVCVHIYIYISLSLSLYIYIYRFYILIQLCYIIYTCIIAT